MAMVAGPALSTDRAPTKGPRWSMVVTDAFTKEAIIVWFRGEFATANAMINVMCGQFAQVGGGGAKYETIFATIHRRRLNWIHMLQMLNYHSIVDVEVELRKVVGKKVEEKDGDGEKKSKEAKGDCLEKEKVW